MNTVPFLAIYAAVTLVGIAAVAAAFLWAANRRQERVREYRRMVRARLRVRQNHWIESLCEPADARASVRLTA